jgi:hypothetical protein
MEGHQRILAKNKKTFQHTTSYDQYYTRIKQMKLIKNVLEALPTSQKYVIDE